MPTPDFVYQSMPQYFSSRCLVPVFYTLSMKTRSGYQNVLLVIHLAGKRLIDVAVLASTIDDFPEVGVCTNTNPCSQLP